MRASCAICLDLFDEINEISAAPCGHVFHFSCLTTWAKVSSTCPSCRAPIQMKNIQKLFFSFVPSSGFSISELENKIANLKVQLSAEDVKPTEFKENVQYIQSVLIMIVEMFEESLQKHDTLINKLGQEFDKHVSEMLALEKKVDSLNVKLQSAILTLEQRYVASSNILEHLKLVKTIAGVTQIHVGQILRVFNDHSIVTELLPDYCIRWKRGFRTLLTSVIELYK